MRIKKFVKYLETLRINYKFKYEINLVCLVDNLLIKLQLDGTLVE